MTTVKARRSLTNKILRTNEKNTEQNSNEHLGVKLLLDI